MIRKTTKRASDEPRAKPRRPARTGDSPPTAAEKRRATELLRAIEAAYPDAHCELHYRTPHELLVATILSAQTTDVAVNKATPALFERFPTPRAYAEASPEEIEPYVRTLGFFRNKARAVHEAMREIAERFGGEVPRTMDELLTLRGVARKTANVVLGNAYRINEGFVVDTHVERLAVRLGLAPHGANVAQIERRLMSLFPRDRWCDLSHMLIWHGRRACKARMPACSDHPVCQRFGSACELRVTAKPGKGGASGGSAGAVSSRSAARSARSPRGAEKNSGTSTRRR